MSDEHVCTPGSGNVFADLGITDPGEAQVKAQLARKISSIVQNRHLTQAQAADLLGIDQPKVSALMRGRLSGFSTERLCRFLVALGRDVTIVVGERPRKQPAIQVVTGAAVRKHTAARSGRATAAKPVSGKDSSAAPVSGAGSTRSR